MPKNQVNATQKSGDLFNDSVGQFDNEKDLTEFAVSTMRLALGLIAGIHGTRLAVLIAIEWLKDDSKLIVIPKIGDNVQPTHHSATEH